MPTFPTPTPFVFESTPYPTPSINIGQDIAVNGVQLWNMAPDGVTILLQALIVLMIVIVGVVVISSMTERIQ